MNEKNAKVTWDIQGEPQMAQFFCILHNFTKY